MAPHREGKRSQLSKSRIPRLLRVIEEENGNTSEAENPQIVPRPRLPHSAQDVAKKGVSQPALHLRPGSSCQATSHSPEPHPQNSTPFVVGTATASSNSPPTPTIKTRHSLSQALTTAENVRELNITGGLFLNTPQATVQVYGGIPSGCRPVEEISQGHDKSDNSLAVPVLEHSAIETQSVRQPTESKGNAKASIQCQMKDYDVYYRQLLLAGRGSPMWIPGPNMMLPKEYRRSGIGIGDVGIVYRSEGFSFLFNVFLPADHPVNEGRVPDEFEPIDFGRVEKDLEKKIVYGRGHHLASSSLRNVSGVDSLGLVFETVASEGAILIMPDGATTEDLLNHKLLKAYIAKNAQSWYTYIREERGREVHNGDIRLVIGFDKVASWGIATFASSIEQQVRLEFKSNDSGLATSRAYTWNCIGGGSGRVGPHLEEMEDLREPNDPVPKNQTVFVRTLNFNLKGDAQDDLTTHEIRSSDHSSNNSGPPRSSNQQPPSSSGGQSSTGSGTSHSGQGNVKFQAAQFGLSVTQHPSNQINGLLLKKFPNAQMVITDDADWISVLTKADMTLPSPEDIYARLLSSRQTWEIDGVVTIEGHANPEGEVSVTSKRNLSNGVTQSKDMASYMLPGHHVDHHAQRPQDKETKRGLPSLRSISLMAAARYKLNRTSIKTGLIDQQEMKPECHNIIVFGEAGCGKSSIVNMIVGNAVAKVSNGFGGCTFQYESYEADIGGTAFRIFDTAGLDEGDEGRVPHWKAVQGLYTLIRQLDGVSLLVFCVRGRIKANTRANWILFNKVICGETVPAIAVVTGLEDEVNPDDWWGREENKEVFRRYKVKPKGVSCVVSVRGHKNQYAAQYQKSQEKLRKLILNSYRREPWSKDKDAWFSHIYCEVYHAGICFFTRKSKEFTTVMKNAVEEFAREVGMDEERSEKLKRALLLSEKAVEKAEKRTRNKSRQRIIWP